MIVTRFAPSPTGFLHLGHVYSLICSYEYSKNHNGKFVLRIEDIDFTRCKNFYAEQIINDINWLKIPFIRTKDQSMRKNQYSLALDYLKSKDLIYPCWLSRKEAKETLTAPQDEISETAVIEYPSHKIVRLTELIVPLTNSHCGTSFNASGN